MLDLVACLGHLGMIVLVFMAPFRDAVARITLLLTTSLFAWNLAAFAYGFSGAIEWHWFDLSISPLSGALVFHLTMEITGKARRFRVVLLLNYCACAVPSLGAVLAFVVPAARVWVDASSWSWILLADVAPMTVLCIGLLVGHLRASRGEERARSVIILIALIIGTLTGITELLGHMNLPVPGLGNVGTFVSSALLTLVTVRYQFLGTRISGLMALVAIGLAFLLLSGLVIAVDTLGVRAPLTGVAVAIGLVVAFVAVQRNLDSRATAQLRLENFAALGRLSAQMAHDLKNPLAALKGAVQFLREELAQGRSLGGHQPFLELMEQQIDRIDRSTAHYVSLAQLHPRLIVAQLNETLKEVLSLQSFASGGVAVRAELDPSLPVCRFDRDLIASAVENLVRNAIEATPPSGRVTVRTKSARPLLRRAAILVSVEDTGRGMDTRTAEKAFDDFFTTKDSGTGLGLPFVRRVVKAHNGEIRLRSQLEKGTIVTIRLPVTGILDDSARGGG